MTQRVTLTPAIQAWRATCPLRRWLDEGRKSDGGKGRPERFRRLMEATRISTRSGVYAWLYGRALPKQVKLVAIRQVTGITPDQLVAWWNARPQEDGQWLDETRAVPSDSTPAGS